MVFWLPVLVTSFDSTFQKVQLSIVRVDEACKVENLPGVMDDTPRCGLVGSADGRFKCIIRYYPKGLGKKF